MTKLVYTPAALVDIDRIYDYSLEQWGLDQANTYVRSIDSICRALANGQQKGRDAGNIRTDYFKQQCGSHFVFYKRNSNVMTVIRILHQSMDFDRHF